MPEDYFKYKMDIQIYGNKILKQKCLPVTSGELSQLQNFIDEMVKTLRSEKTGVGLAAPQVNSNKRIAVVEWEGNLKILINPKITRKSGQKVKQEEGCLSLPGIYLEIKRPEKVEIEFLDRKGNPQKIVAAGFLGRVMQHEIDHLDGKLIVDRLNFWKRRKIKKQLQEHFQAK